MSGGNDGGTFTNVFDGTIEFGPSQTGKISGDWADVPRGVKRGYGSLALKITGPTTFEKVAQSGPFPFGGVTWQKVR